jgi:TRAP-type uncharacterized transport system fused permease subunit
VIIFSISASRDSRHIMSAAAHPLANYEWVMGPCVLVMISAFPTATHDQQQAVHCVDWQLLAVAVWWSGYTYGSYVMVTIFSFLASTKAQRY